jgi:hypothetical protein
MQPVNPATGAILVKLQALSIVLPVLGGCIGSLLALGAGEIYYASGFCFLGHNLIIPESW